MNIAIFGAGIAGLMSAITLRAQGQCCRVYERSSLAQEAGMGFILVPEAIAALERFGVHLSGDVNGTPLRRYHCRDSGGRIVYEQAMPAGSRGIRRRDLTTALMRGLDRGEAVVFADFEGLDVDEDFHVTAAHLRWQGASRAVIADLYIGAEGVNSRARHAIFPDWPVTPDQVPEFVGLVRCEKALHWADHNLNKFHAAEGGMAFGILPVDDEHVVWYLQFDSRRFPLTAEVMHGEPRVLARARRTFVESLVGAWANPIPSLVANTDFSREHLWRPIETDLIPRFHRGNVVLVGDAAHPLSPFTSQGVSSAVADAIALAEEVDGASSKDDLMQGLDRYSARRHAQCAPYVAQGRDLVQRFLQPLSEGNAVLPIATRSDAAPVLARTAQRSAFAQEA
jgi:2-polyprenyl-6-methoxyphenol hydroxylase-like FAD-dependent oxidoreductase